MRDNDINSELSPDIERIQSLDIVPSILDLVCQTTGLGFAAIARVTDKKWIACAVNDKISFGLKPGGELLLETTICNEIQTHYQPVIIDDVHEDPVYRDHHTPKMYGFRSYISIPIFLKNGSFFGTLCAIDPKPAALKGSNATAMFTLFADLLSFQLLLQDQIKAKSSALHYTEARLEDSLEDIRQYSHISRHTLQEPLRKLRVFTNIVATDKSLPEDHHLIPVMKKINGLAEEFASMIGQLTDFSETIGSLKNFRTVDLNQAVETALLRLHEKIQLKDASVEYQHLPTVQGIPQQLTLLFFFILDNALNFVRPDIKPEIKIYATEMHENEHNSFRHLAYHAKYCKVVIEDNGIGMNEVYTRQIFDLFVRLNSKESFPGLGMGLSQAKKIMRNHEGAILVDSVLNKGSKFTLILPFERQAPAAQ